MTNELVKDQKHTDQYSIYNGDCIDVISDLPDESMSCEGTNIPNLVRRVGSTVRVDHPNPGQFGLTEFYVTNESHQVHLVGGGAS